MTKDIHVSEEIASLRWSCRRGMLELDLLLGRFLDTSFLSLPPAERELFKELLNYTDPELFAWLLGSQPPEPQFLSLLKKIQAYAYPTTSVKTV